MVKMWHTMVALMSEAFSVLSKMGCMVALSSVVKRGCGTVMSIHPSCLTGMAMPSMRSVWRFTFIRLSRIYPVVLASAVMFTRWKSCPLGTTSAFPGENLSHPSSPVVACVVISHDMVETMVVLSRVWSA